MSLSFPQKAVTNKQARSKRERSGITQQRSQHGTHRGAVTQRFQRSSPHTRAPPYHLSFATELFLGFVLFLLALGYLYEALEFLVTIWELTLFAPL